MMAVAGLWLLINFGVAICGRILVFPSPFDVENAERMKELADGLSAREHDVTVWMPRFGAQPNIQPPSKPILRTVAMDEDKFHNFENSPATGLIASFEEDYKRGSTIHAFLSEFIDKHRGEMDWMVSQNWDAIIADDLDSPIALVISRLRKTPLILFASNHLTELTALGTGSFFPTSFLPVSTAGYTNDMNIFERLVNSFKFMVRNTGFIAANRYMDLALKGIPELEATSLLEIRRSADFVFVDFPRILDYPRPGLSNIIDLSGLECANKSPAPVPADILNRVENSKGLVVVLLALPQTNDVELQALADAFGSFKEQIFVWYYPGKISANLSSNIIVTSERSVGTSLLGHKRAKLVVADGKKRSVYDSICNGLPLVGVPTQGLETGALTRLVRKKAALILHPMQLRSSDQIAHVLKTIQSQSLFRHNIASLKEAMEEETQTPLDTAVFWTEYTVRHQGAGPLNPPLPQVSVVAYYMLDFWLGAFLALYILSRIAYFLASLTGMKNKMKMD